MLLDLDLDLAFFFSELVELSDLRLVDLAISRELSEAACGRRERAGEGVVPWSWRLIGG